MSLKSPVSGALVRGITLQELAAHAQSRAVVVDTGAQPGEGLVDVSSETRATRAERRGDVPVQDRPVGWYRDASQPTGHRYWDGRQWLTTPSGRRLTLVRVPAARSEDAPER
jgi:hypothetical protein